MLASLRGGAVLNLSQGWRGSAKGRHFITALKDYYTEKAAGVQAAWSALISGLSGISLSAAKAPSWRRLTTMRAAL